MAGLERDAEMTRRICRESSNDSLVARSAKRCVGSGATFGNSDPFLAGLGRMGVTMITPPIPVLPLP